jgi:hypothetical protein
MGIPHLLISLEKALLLRNDGLGHLGEKLPIWAVDMSVLIHSRLAQCVGLLADFNVETMDDFLFRIGQDCLTLLRYAKVVYFVFDGRRIAAKLANASRAASVEEAREKLATPGLSDAEVYRWSRKAVQGLATQVAPYVRCLLRAFQHETEFEQRVHVHVALYEADSHINGLWLKKMINAVFTIDSDFIAGFVGNIIFTETLRAKGTKRGVTWHSGTSRVYSEGDATGTFSAADDSVPLASLYKQFGRNALRLIALFAGNDYAKIENFAFRGAVKVAAKLNAMTVPAFIEQMCKDGNDLDSVQLEQIARTSATFLFTQPVYFGGDHPDRAAADRLERYLPPAGLFPDQQLHDFPWPDDHFITATPDTRQSWLDGEFDVTRNDWSRCAVFESNDVSALARQVKGKLAKNRQFGLPSSLAPVIAAPSMSKEQLQQYLSERGIVSDGSREELLRRVTWKQESLQHKGLGFNDLTQDRADQDREEYQFNMTVLKPHYTQSTPYPPPCGPLRLVQKTIIDYFQADGADTLRQDLAVKSADPGGRVSSELVCFVVPQPAQASPDIFNIIVFGDVEPSYVKSVTYRAAVSLWVMQPATVIAIQWTVCMLPLDAELDENGVVISKAAKMCLNRDLCAHSRLLLERIRVLGLPEGSTQGVCQWGTQEGGMAGGFMTHTRLCARLGMPHDSRSEVSLEQVSTQLAESVRLLGRDAGAAVAEAGSTAREKRTCVLSELYFGQPSTP